MILKKKVQELTELKLILKLPLMICTYIYSIVILSLFKPILVFMPTDFSSFRILLSQNTICN